MNMKFRMKTMATLIAAVLIAMMGVMPALAQESATATLEVDVRETLVISIIITYPESPYVVDFGIVYPDDIVDRTVTINNDGDFIVDVAGVVSGAFFLSNMGVSANLEDLAVDASDDFTLTLTVPTIPTEYVTHSGSILFTASLPA